MYLLSIEGGFILNAYFFNTNYSVRDILLKVDCVLTFRNLTQRCSKLYRDVLEQFP